MPTALIGLGSNLGDRRQWLDQAIQLLSATPGIAALRASTWHATSPIGGPDGQPDFLNGAAVVETALPPESLWARLQEIETALGRVRHQPWGPRTIDLDMLLYDQIVQPAPRLALPHPRMAYRRFVLQPAAEVASQMIHPVSGWSITDLLHHLNTAAPYVAISGSLFRATQQLAQAAAIKTGWNLIEFPFPNPPHLEEGRVRVQNSTPAGSPSLGLAQTIEFLRQQAELLARTNWPADSRGAISSFWIEDLLAIGDVLWPGQLDELWRSLAETVVRPKLLVVCQATSQQFQADPNSAYNTPSSLATAFWHRLNETRRARAARPGIGPVLWLDSSDQPSAERELVAAIQAMN